jgi:hypothetical protein
MGGHCHHTNLGVYDDRDLGALDVPKLGRLWLVLENLKRETRNKSSAKVAASSTTDFALHPSWR